MPLLRLILLACWTIALVRLASTRATLSGRTFFIYFLQGAFLGIVGVRLVQRLFVPYSQSAHGPVIILLIALAWQASLLAPVWILLTDHLSRVTSVDDAFLVAFAMGFGFDLCGALTAAATASYALPGLSLFPPWQFHNKTVTFAGYA